MLEELNQTETSPSEIEAQVAAVGRTIEEDDSGARDAIIREALIRHGPVAVAQVLFIVAARLRAERTVLQSCLEKKERLIGAMLAAPRRLAKVLGVIREERDGAEEARAVIQGPPPLAVQCAPDVDINELCPDWPDKPVWAWLIESEGGLVIGGRFTPPPLLEANLAQEMRFAGFSKGVANEAQT